MDSKHLETPTTMSKHFKKICNTENFGEICKIVESVSANASHKGIVLVENDYTRLRELTKSVAIRLLNNEDKIPDALFNLSTMLGDEYYSTIKSIVTNFVVSRKSADISQFIHLNFQNPESLRKIFVFLEKTIDEVSNLYDNLPADLNLELKLVTKSLVMIKQIVCEHFFTSDVEPECYSTGLICTINFEKKLEMFFTNKMCCMSPETTEDDGSSRILDKCIHKRMLSSVFVPHLEVFFEYYLTKKLGNGIFVQSSVEKNIIRGYIDFFKQLEYVYSIATYLDDKMSYVQLVTIVDRTLFTMIRKTRVEEIQSKMVIVISTILYVQHVLEEFINNVSAKQHVELKLVSMEASRKLERHQGIKLERSFNNNFTGNIPDFINAYNSIFEGHVLISDEVRSYVLELCMSQLFAKISAMKMNTEISLQMESEMKMLEHRLSQKFDAIPHLGLIMDYLKIFTFPPEPKEAFVKNFDTLSRDRFEFTQILKVFEDQRLAFKMYEVFKKFNK